MQAYSCQPCNVAFATEQGWQQHLLSAQHLAVVQALLGGSVAPISSMLYSAGATDASQYQLQQQQQQQLQQIQLHQQQQELLHQQSLLSQAASSSVLSPNQFQALQLAQLASNSLNAQDPMRSTVQQMQKLQQAAQAQQRAARLLDLRQQGPLSGGGLDQLSLLQGFPGGLGLGQDSILGSAPGSSLSLLSQPLFSVGAGAASPGRRSAGGRLGDRQPVSKFTVVKKPDSGRSQPSRQFPSNRDLGPPDEPGCCRNCGEKGHGLRDCPRELSCANCGRKGHTHHVCRDGGRASSPSRGPSSDGPCRNCGSIDHGLRDCPREIFCTRCRRTGHTRHVCKEPLESDESPFGGSGAKRSASQSTPFDHVSGDTFGRPKGEGGEAGERRADGPSNAAASAMPFGPSAQSTEATATAGTAAPFGSNIVMPTLFPFGNKNANDTFSFGLTDPDQRPEPAEAEPSPARPEPAPEGPGAAGAAADGEAERPRGEGVDLDAELARFKAVWNAAP